MGLMLLPIPSGTLSQFAVFAIMLFCLLFPAFLVLTRGTWREHVWDFGNGLHYHGTGGDQNAWIHTLLLSRRLV